MNDTIFWYDYETFGIDPMIDKIAQFAGIRTDLDMNIIGDEYNFYCKMAQDYLPKPKAMFVTGLTPQLVNQRGDNEALFIKKINDLFSVPSTCVAGYNSINFDDEFTRNALYRNFFDPYSREYKNNNSRWDIIDLARGCYALRPDGIKWPKHEDGKPSFKLEDLARENNLIHENAHDALSDVKATIALAKLIKEKQPKLFEYFFAMRFKDIVLERVFSNNLKPLIFINRMISSSIGCTSIILPAGKLQNSNKVAYIDLTQDISLLFELTVEELKGIFFNKRDDDNNIKLPINTFEINKSPFLAPINSLNDTSPVSIMIDKEFAISQYKLIMDNSFILQKVIDIYTNDSKYESSETDPDKMIYSGGFFSDYDRKIMNEILTLSPDELVGYDFKFQDSRLKEMFFRYKARNYPHILDAEEEQRWINHCKEKLDDIDYINELNILLEETEDQREKKILEALCSYIRNL